MVGRAPSQLRFLLLQARDADDPMRLQEVDCFAETMKVALEQIEVFDLLTPPELSRSDLAAADVVLLGGSDHSVVAGGPWLPAALRAMQLLYEVGKPTFASCWGFQAMAAALGGQVETDLSSAELGTTLVEVTEAGRSDPVFAVAGDSFEAQMGHQDIVVRLPREAIRLASSARVENEAYTFPDKPIYGTQFHPELNRRRLLERLEAYPHYVQRIAGVSMAEFASACRDTPASAQLLGQFLKVVFAPT